MDLKKLIDWIRDKANEYEEIAFNSMSDSRAVRYMGMSNAMKEVIKYIEENKEE